jgi:hypothetical protein
MPEKRFFPGAGIHWTLADFLVVIRFGECIGDLVRIEPNVRRTPARNRLVFLSLRVAV